MFDNLFKDESINVTGLTEELKAIYVYDKFIKTNKSILLVSSSLYSANNFYKSLKNYTDDVLFFPMDNFLTSEALAISPELENDRLSTINELIKDNKKIVVTNLMGYLRYLPSRKNYTDSIIKINTDDEYNIDTLVNNLIDIGYKRETIVTKTGEIAVRGFVVDIFPLDQEKPIRLEYWGDTIESIREFNVDTQLTVDNVKNVTILPMTERTNGIYDSISNYLDDNITVFNEYNQLLKDYEDLLNEDIDDKYKQQIEFELYDKDDYINKDKISKFLDTLSYPLYFLDFETYQESIPEYDGISPYMQIPFQYSLHYIEEDGGELYHKEFLAEAGIDPRRSLAERLVKDIPKGVCVMAYNMMFEKMIIKNLAEFFPDLSDHLMNIYDNMCDLMIPFKDRDYYSKEMSGSYSIKYVLPALFPDDPSLDYHNLEGVHNGSEAMETYANLGNYNKEEQEVIRNNLLRYCELDTYAMVKIYEKLKSI